MKKIRHSAFDNSKPFEILTNQSHIFKINNNQNYYYIIILRRIGIKTTFILL